MKLAVCVLLAMAALAYGDSSYQQYQQHQPYQNYYEQQSAPSAPNYYQNGVAPAQRRQSFFETVRDFFRPTPRQDDFFAVGPSIGIIGFIIIVFIVIGIIGIVVPLASLSNITSSGKGRDNDEWEVDHSVWMNQLQKDFEDSWSSE